ncbi:MAG: hypothetical protein ACYSTN_04630, partial [Planctomycetota bacterium]
MAEEKVQEAKEVKEGKKEGKKGTQKAGGEKSVKKWSKETSKLGDAIVGLTLIQAKELCDYLKDEYGIEPA